MKRELNNISGLLAIAVAVITGGFNSCSYDKGKEANPVGQCDTTVYTYTANITSIFQTNCSITGCHDGQTGIGGVQFSSYQDVKSKVDAGRITARMIDGTGGFMPPSGQLDTAIINMVQQWINEGSCE